MFSLAVFHLSANNCTTKMHSILGANKHERGVSILSLLSKNGLQLPQIEECLELTG